MIESRTKDMMILAARAQSSVSFCLVMFVACCDPRAAPTAIVVEVGTVAVDAVVSSDAAGATGASGVTGATGATPDVAGATLI